MAVKIWDAQSNAFKDAEIPMVWDSQAGAYKDSTGLVYDESAGAWDERWGKTQLFIYDNGVKNNDYVMISNKYLGRRPNNDYHYMSCISLDNQVDLGKYNKLCADIKITATRNNPLACGFLVSDYPMRTITEEQFLNAYHGKALINGDITTCDISNINGKKYVAIEFGNTSSLDSLAQCTLEDKGSYLHRSGYGGEYQADVYKFWLE